MAEDLTLTDPITKPAESITKYKILSMLFDRITIVSPGGEPGYVSILVADNFNVKTTIVYEGAQAMEYIKFVNTANFSVNSMQKKTLQKLSADGKLPPGTVTGTPE